MSNKRTTIYDLARELGLSVSYVSKALNNKPGVSEKVRREVLKKVEELSYKHNTQAANLRRGSSRTLGVIVPHINQSFFSDAIAGMEKACAENSHSLIICQSQEKYETEKSAIETLIHQNVACILISVSKETQSKDALEQVINHGIQLIQFDRCIDSFDSHKVENDNLDATYKAVKSMIGEGYKQIAFIGGPPHIYLFKQRKEGFIKAIREAGLPIPYNFIVDDNLSKEDAFRVAMELLSLPSPPDAFFTISDLQALGVLEAAKQNKKKVPQEVGIFGYANEPFTQIIEPSISTIDQKSEDLGYRAAMVYFNEILGDKESSGFSNTLIESELVIRQSSRKKCSIRCTTRPPYSQE